ncbi:probable Arginine N-methyltransferase 2 [Cephalotrichum gorgonifer]|uniref:Arginine N-methyltransferase 2 n=1 Tax=Cephalotrichum gorgonifer TaxID=2041049 RepID=A0AAE8MWF9_9PEZI|nr:probable Arginine N-methyltransferase 2 [Cephalotrichum gorgonifer]
MAAPAVPTPIDDSLQARVSPDCPPATQQVLYNAWARDLSGLKPLLDAPENARLQDPTTGETPLHAAIRSCGPADPKSDEAQEEDGEVDGCVEEAIDVLKELFFSGAIWNDVDNHDETPGCVAWRLGRPELYKLCMEAGVRAELLFGLMGGYEELSSAGGEDVDMEILEEVEVDGEEAPELVAVEADAQEPEPEKTFQAPVPEDGKDVTSDEYLRSALTYSDGKLVDEDGNGVMMAWETDIMRRSVDALLPDLPSGKRILNVGFGMGIIDSMFADTKPSRHHIIEAHPDVLARLSEPDSPFGSKWEASGPEEGAFKVLGGRWQDILPQLLGDGEVYDAIYFDTFGEDYSQLKYFFTEFVPGLLDSEGRLGFFNGLGADRRICYDVYTKVAEMHLSDAGLDVDWEVIKVDMKGLEEAGKGEWEGVRRRYWTLDGKFLKNAHHITRLNRS